MNEYLLKNKFWFDLNASLGRINRLFFYVPIMIHVLYYDRIYHSNFYSFVLCVYLINRDFLKIRSHEWIEPYVHKPCIISRT